MNKPTITLKCSFCGLVLPDKYRGGKTIGSVCPNCKKGLMEDMSKNVKKKERNG